MSLLLVSGCFLLIAATNGSDGSRAPIQSSINLVNKPRPVTTQSSDATSPLIKMNNVKNDEFEKMEDEKGGFYAPIHSSFNVVLEPKQITILSSEVSSSIIKIHKRMGDEFEKNDVLISLDSRVYKVNSLKAQAAVTKFMTELEAKKILYKDDALSKFELHDAVASLASSEADLTLADKLLQNTEIKAPFKGKVVRLAVEEFEYAQQGKELIQIVNSEQLYARFLVPSNLALSLYVGAPVNIFVRETNENIHALLSHISPVIDPASSTIKIEAELDNVSGKLWSGMSGIATFKNKDTGTK